MPRFNAERTYPYLFFAMVAAYCLLYAPYGINETDNGFISGLAWQLMCGKTLYHDVLYVRPPLPVWLRAGELLLLPETWSVLGERYIFYLKVALYTWLAADLLAKRSQRWILAGFGFIVSVHSYPACAWHTIDGILFSVGAVWLYSRTFKRLSLTLLCSLLAGKAFFAAMLCKQSFYPLVILFPVIFLLYRHPWRLQRLLAFTISAGICLTLFLLYLSENSLSETYFQMTGAAASGGQALQHGLLDYFRIKPVLALFSVLLLSPVGWWYWKRKNPGMAAATWGLWVSLLPAVYVLEFWKREEFTAPFSQSRLLFLTGVAYAGWQLAIWWKNRNKTGIPKYTLPYNIAVLILLLAISWSASVSWGYNLPILFATPWVFTTLQIGHTLWKVQFGKTYPASRHIAGILLLLVIGRFSYEFVYRDGRRSEMTVNLGTIFTKLDGIYSSPETAGLYLNLDSLSRRYGPDFVVLPAFPQAHFLTNSCSPLPLDWVVQREINGGNQLVMNSLEGKKPVLFIEKSFAEKIKSDPELEPTRALMRRGTVIGETAHFQIMRYE